jgi:hypothetical protein
MSDEPLVFHYTNAAGALGILNSKEIWTTLVYHLNDVQEVHYAQRLARQLASDQAALLPPDQRDPFLERFEATQEQVRQTHIFAASFSRDRDVLSQWRGYAGAGGYALGFAVASLETAARGAGGLRTGYVCYDHAEQRAMLLPAINELVSIVATTPVESIPTEGLNPFWRAIMKIVALAPLIKHPGFAEEEEWRLYTDASKQSARKYDFLTKNGELVPIYKMPLTNTITDRGKIDIGLRHVVTGPGDHLERRQNAIFAAINRYDIDWRMGSGSQTPYR